MDPDLLFAGYLALPWLTLVGGAALGTVIVALVGALRAGFRRRGGRDSVEVDGTENVELAELFKEAMLEGSGVSP